MSTAGDSSSSTVNLLDLASAAVGASIVAADKIKALAQQRDALSPDAPDDAMNVQLKDDGSFVTNADLSAQQIIVQSIRKVSTRVRLVGEEEETFHNIAGFQEKSDQLLPLAKEEVYMRYNYALERTSSSDPKEPLVEATSDTLPLAQSPPFEESVDAPLMTKVLPPLSEYEVDTTRVSVFIDPLDGTKAYTKGDYGPVSILIAVILDHTPCFGVICKPFGYPRQPSVLDTGCVVIYGGTLLGAAYTAGSGGISVGKAPSLTIPNEEELLVSSETLPRAVISSSRSQGIVQEFVTHLGSKGMINPTPLMITGAGEKSLRIILRTENEGLWFFPKAGTSLWDVAASDALLRATGGRLTDKNGNDMDYSKSRLQAENLDGVVACYDHSLHTECIKLFLEGTWKET
eukprot:Nitzschia sp. Nitz4//scaffold64_size103689//60457//61665//NITZ4_004438-RA/size103689-processed-gene-0.103-mRNA-1//-1//CDS//3329556136//3275//frame0